MLTNVEMAEAGQYDATPPDPDESNTAGTLSSGVLCCDDEEVIPRPSEDTWERLHWLDDMSNPATSTLTFDAAVRGVRQAAIRRSAALGRSLPEQHYPKAR